MELTLRRAAKIIKKVSTEFEAAFQETRKNLIVQVEFSDPDGTFYTKLSEAKEQLARSRDRMVDLAFARTDLRLLLGKANQEFGVNTIVTVLKTDELVLQKLRSFEDYMMDEDRPSVDVIESRIKAAREQALVPNGRGYGSFSHISTNTLDKFDREDLKEEISKLASEIEDHIDRLERINTSCSIELTDELESHLRRLNIL